MHDRVLIHTFVSNETIEYFYYMRDNYLSLSSEDVDFCCYTYDQYCYNKFNKAFKTFLLQKYVPETVTDAGRGAYLHYVTIKKAFENFQDCFNIIADTDTIVLIKDWDKIIKQKLIDNYCIGASYYSIWHYRGYPSFIWCAFRNDLQGYDKIFHPPFTQGAKDVVIPLTIEDCNFYNINYKNESLKYTYANYTSQYNFDTKKYIAIMIADPGWNFPKFLVENNLNYICFRNTNNSDHDKAFVRVDMSQLHTEYWLDDKLILSHQEGARGSPFRQVINSSEFYNAAEDYLKAQFEKNNYSRFYR